jgi:ribosomal protein L37E
MAHLRCDKCGSSDTNAFGSLDTPIKILCKKCSDEKFDVHVCFKTHKVNDIINEKIVFLGTFDECLKWKHENGFGYKISELNDNKYRITNKY